MSRSQRFPRQAVVEHKARLEILSCLDPSVPLSVAHVCRRTGLHSPQVKHHLRILNAFDLIKEEKREENAEDEQPHYVSRLKQSPAWVTRAVNRQRHRRRTAAE